MNEKQNFAITTLEYCFVAGFIIFEELIWNVLAQPLINWLNQLKIFEKMRQYFQLMHPNLVLFVFIVIFLVTEILGILSGLTVVSGRVFWGALIYLMKVPVAAFTFWLFDLTKPKLMTFEWLKSMYDVLMSWKGIIEDSDMYRNLKHSVHITREKIQTIKYKYLGERSFYDAVKTQYLLVKTFFIRPQ
ncbi:MAG: hypothetical protein K0U68_01380 [Gammaproteobacteria bacterium]|nr:hypothetical protein [Gammaproteobacteria bacterium]